MSGQREKSQGSDFRGSKPYFQKLAEVGLVGMATGRPDKGILEFNDTFCDMLGYARGELRDKRWNELTHPDDLDEDHRRFNQMLAGEIEGYSIEKRYVRKDGTFLYARISITCSRRPDGSVEETFGIIQDISEQKRLELSLREHQQRLEETLASQAAALEEQEALLREVNHRVKNNLQVLISMLRLQSQRDKRPGVREALTDALQRIIAMSTVHENIYGAHPLSRIDLQKYVTDLVRELRGSSNAGSGIAFTTHVEPGIRLEADRAVPCGMVLNELIANTIKHAFPEGGSGHVSVEGRRMEDGRIRITVRDNGAGMPEGFDWRSADTLGLTLIVGLVEKQLEGDIEAGADSGAAFSFTFRETDEGRPPF